MPRIAAWRPHHDDQPAVEKSRGDKSRLSAFATVRHAGDVQAVEDFTGASKIKSAFLQGLGAFDLGPGQLPYYLCTPINQAPCSATGHNAPRPHDNSRRLPVEASAK
jgi:hypothetical protein